MSHTYPMNDEDDNIDYFDEFRKYSYGDILIIDGCYVLEQLTTTELAEYMVAKEEQGMGRFICRTIYRQQQIVQITKMPPEGSTDDVEYEVILFGPDWIIE